MNKIKFIARPEINAPDESDPYSTLERTRHARPLSRHSTSSFRVEVPLDSRYANWQTHFHFTSLVIQWIIFLLWLGWSGQVPVCQIVKSPFIFNITHLHNSVCLTILIVSKTIKWFENFIQLHMQCLHTEQQHNINSICSREDYFIYKDGQTQAQTKKKSKNRRKKTAWKHT